MSTQVTIEQSLVPRFPDEPQLTPALGYLGAGTLDLSAFGTAPVTFDYLDRDDLVITAPGSEGVNGQVFLFASERAAAEGIRPGAPVTFEFEGRRRRPDFRLRLGGWKLMLEVKEFGRAES